MRALVLVMLALVLSLGGIGCGGKRAPARPAPIDPRALAAELAGELAEVAYVVHAHRDDCPTLASALRGVFARMRASIAVAHRAQLDEAMAKQLVIEMRAYDQVTAQHTAAIEADFTASARCANAPEVREVMMSMPTL